MPAFRRQFPHVDEEALELFAAEGGSFGEIAATISEMQREALADSMRRGGMGELPTRGCVLRRSGDAGSQAEELELEFEGGDDPPRCGTVLLIEGLEACFAGVAGKASDGDDAVLAAMAIPTGEVLALESHPGTLCFRIADYGTHELRVRSVDGRVLRRRFMSSSHLGDFAQALDHFHDSCDWVWDGQWTEALEDATMQLLSALDDEFTALEASLQRNPLGSSLLSEIGPSRRRLDGALAKALEGHDAQSVGRVYGAVRSFLSSQSVLNMFGPMVGGVGAAKDDSMLYQCVMEFERARHTAASPAKRAEVKAALSNLISAADAYVAGLNAGQSADFTMRWHSGLRDILLTMRDDPDSGIHPKPFQQLRGEGGGQFGDMMKTVVESFGRRTGSVSRADTIEGVTMLSPQDSYADAQSRVSRWIESLVDESVGFGSPMAPFEVHAHGGDSWVQTVMAAVNSLLSLGFGYVTAGADKAPTSKLIALLDRDRATLPLDDYGEFLSDRRRRDRLKDVTRVVRAARRKGQRLTLTVNSDFSNTLQALKAHHADNWVGPSLEAIWERMVPEKRCFAFELWLREPPPKEGCEAPAPRLVAADFGHPHTHGCAYYVATRFFDRDYRTLQPGFVLAFAEAECLRRAGFSLWDLGGADKSPMMQYKPQVAVEMGRCDFLRRLRECSRAAEAAAALAGAPLARREAPITDPAAAPPAGGERVPTGTIFDDIGEDDLWGAAELRARDESERQAVLAAQSSAKKTQKPQAPKKAANAGAGGGNAQRRAGAVKVATAGSGGLGDKDGGAGAAKVAAGGGDLGGRERSDDAATFAPPARGGSGDGSADAAKVPAAGRGGPGDEERSAETATDAAGGSVCASGGDRVADAATVAKGSGGVGDAVGGGLANGVSAASEADAKALAKQRFHAIFEQLLADGMPRADAVARALQLVSRPSS